jgi:hypothetical protein
MGSPVRSSLGRAGRTWVPPPRSGTLQAERSPEYVPGETDESFHRHYKRNHRLLPAAAGRRWPKAG